MDERRAPAPAAPGPGSVAWRYVGDWRLLLGVGRALLLQVAHPTVGAGVSQFSSFRSDPWGRFDRTLTSLMTQVYGGAAAEAEARRLRQVHARFTGVDHRGRPYRALDPAAYWWVHATIFDTVLSDHAVFGRPLRPADQERLYREWCALGRLLGIPPAEMPAGAGGFRDWFDTVVAGTLGDNPAVRDLLDALDGSGTPPPPWWPVPEPVWRPVRDVLGGTLTHVTTGTLPPVLRQRLGLAWGRREELRLTATAAVVRGAVPAVPARWRYHPIAARARRTAGG